MSENVSTECFILVLCLTVFSNIVLYTAWCFSQSSQTYATYTAAESNHRKLQ